MAHPKLCVPKVVLSVAFAATLLAGGCGDDAEPGAANRPDSGTLQHAPARVLARMVGGVEETDVRVALLIGAEKVRLYFCGGAESYATATRWFDLEADGEDVEFEDDTWRIHAHVLFHTLLGEVERAGDAARMFKAQSFDPATLTGLYEGVAECGRLGLIVTQDTDGNVTAQGACTGATERSQEVKLIEPITSEDGMIRVRTPGRAGGTTLLRPAGLEPL